MKTLLVLRHGKSSWDEPLDDHDRPLNKRGKRDAKRLGGTLRERGVIPDVIISSTAERARSTAKRAAKAMGYGGELVETPELYFTSADDELAVVESAPDQYETVMIVGHNPLFEEIASRLVGHYVRMPTAALACIDLETDSWSEIRNAQSTLRFQLIPEKQEKEP